MFDWYVRDDLPWTSIRSPSDVWKENPTLVLGELLFYLCTSIAIWHAMRCGRQHQLLLVASVVTGTANDIFFMIMPFVDNFFHAQFTIMLTPRLPLYIPCVYICFTYVAAAAVLRLGLPPIAQSAACGLAGGLYYCVYDLFGQKFLWWTWHDTDVAIYERWLGVPFGSSMWTIVHCFCFMYLLHHVALKYPVLSWTRCGFAVVVSALLTTPFMMLSMSPFQMHQIRLQFEPAFEVVQIPGRPDAICLALAVLFCVLVVGQGWKHRRQGYYPGTRRRYAWLDVKTTRSVDDTLWFSLALHFASFSVMMWTCDPSTVVATGVHQEYGPCNVKTRDFMGFLRDEYLCKEAYDEDFNFDCVAQVLPPEEPEWYTLCGNPHKNYLFATSVETLLAFLGFCVFNKALTQFSGSRGVGCDLRTKNK